ncbi:hypothetical protein FQZ97_735220 [compost metagenome]
MKQIEMNATVMRAFVWSGVLVIVTLIVAQGWVMGFVPPPSPNLSAEEIARIFIARRDDILLGSLVQCIFWSLWTVWAIAITMFIRKMEGSMPVLTYASIAYIGGGYVFFLLIPMTWSAIAFRAETLDPAIIQIMNDWVWFDWLFTWPPFAIWMFIIGAAILYDHNVPTIYPRWVGYFNLWCGVLIFPAGMIGFFKTGPFAYDGIISFWEAVVVFFGWILVMTITTFTAINNEERRVFGASAAQSGRSAV